VSSTPRVTVVVPTYQRRDAVLRLLGSLATQAFPPAAFDVVVAVDGSTDGTAEAVREFSAPFPLRALEGPNRGRAGACNAGIRAATGDVIVLLDDDMEAEPGFLAAHVRAHEPSGRRAVVGAAPIASSTESPPFVRYMADGFHARLERMKQPGYRLRFRDAYTGNFSVRRDVLQGVGGFDETFRVYGHEDYELALRLEAAGVELVFDPDALAWQHYEKPFAAFARDGVARGRTAVLFASKHPEVVGSIKLGEYAQGPLKWRLLRGLLLQLSRVTTRVPGWIIAAVTAAERRGAARLDRWYRYAIDFFYWYGVREASLERARAFPPEPAPIAASPRAGVRDL